jgi:hypothetical protein
MLMFDQKAEYVVISAPHQHQYELEGNIFLGWIVTCDEMWMHDFTPGSNQPSMEWCHKGSPQPRKFKTQLSAGKIMESVLGFRKGDHVNFLLYSVTVNAQYYSNLFHRNMHQAIQEKRLGKLSKRIILLHDNARPNRQILWRQYWHQWAGKLWTTVTALT